MPTILGYDPGGNGAHGVATVEVENGQIVAFTTATVATSEKAIRWLIEGREHNPPMGLGIDTLTVWSTGPSGWRPADRLLRGTYPAVVNSVAASNSLFGSMPINGMAVACVLRNQWRDLSISETHPKVMYYALTGKKYQDVALADRWAAVLGQMGLPTTGHLGGADHELDAVLSGYAAFLGLTGQWAADLHTLPTAPGERLVTPCGHTHYWWANMPSDPRD
ncbi:MAG: hypothetical protein WCK05_08805 [Planctomycetota bacterium]